LCKVAGGGDRIGCCFANGNLAKGVKAAHYFFKMQFDYEIPVEEYVAAQVLYYRAYTKNRNVKRALGCAVLGLFFVLIGVSQGVVDWAPILLLLTGVWFIYGGIVSLFPARYYRRCYSESRLAGKKYHAELNENGLHVSGDMCTWQVPWAEVQSRGEDERVFMFSVKGTVFVFGKHYLTDDQQKEIRQFAAL